MIRPTSGAGIAFLYAEDAIRMVPNRPAIKGREAIRASYQSDFDLFKIEETNTVEDAQVVGDLAFVRGAYANKAAPKTGRGC
ncbi:MAG: YybH family protein [Candidatus Aminicenantales bacterium]